jgi:epoxide hydrolase 4
MSNRTEITDAQAPSQSLHPASNPAAAPAGPALLTSAAAPRVAATGETYGVQGAESLRLRANGVELHGVAAGPPDGPMVILLHGFPEFWYGWRHQIGPLAAAGLRVLAPDLRGYNLSSKPEGIAAYTLDVLADDVLGLADALGRRRFAVVGHDWGGILAWHLAARDPERVERAAILNAPHPGTMRDYARARPSQMAKSWYVAFFQLPALPEAMLRAADFAWLRNGMTRTSRAGTFTPEDLRRYREGWSQPGALTGGLNWYRALRLPGGTPKPAPVRAPVRVIWGDRDAFLDPDLAEAGLASCERGEAFHLAGATHWIQHEEPERVNRLLLNFLR